MKSMISDLYYRISEEGKVLQDNREYDSLMYENDKLYKKFCEILSKEQIEILNKIIDNDTGIESEASQAYFIKGFKLGVLTILESIIN